MITARSGTVAKVVDYQGIRVHVDRPIGTVQTGTDADGNAWSRNYLVDYGFLPKTKGGDGEELDVFLGGDELAAEAYAIRQVKSDGTFDEHKLMLGYSSADAARASYLAHVPEQYLGEMRTIAVDHVRALLGIAPTGKAARAAGEQDMSNAAEARSASERARSPDARAALSRPDGLCVREAGLSSLREDAREVDFVCSTESIDSYGEIVRLNWDLTRFESNPVALFAHDNHELPIGYWKDVRVDGTALVGTLKVATAAANPRAEHVWQSIRERTLRAVSVGFYPHKVSFEEIDGVERCCLDNNELFEISVVPIPANPDAIGKMKARAHEEFLRSRTAVTYEATPPVDSGKWDASNTIKRLRRWASSDGSGDPKHINWNQYKRAFAWYDPNRAHELGGFKLPHHDVKDGKLVTSRAGVIAAGNVVQGGRGGAKIPDSEMGAVKAHLAKHYRQFDLTPPWEADKGALAPAQNSAPSRATKESLMATKSKVTCTNCGEEMEMPPDSDSADKNAAVLQRAAEADARAKAAEAERDAKVKAATDAKLAAEARLAEVTEEKLALQVETDLAPLVGVKLAPAEREGHVEIGKLFLSKGDEAGKERWKKHLDGIGSRPDMSQKTGGSVLPTEPETSLAERGSENGAGADASALVNELAAKTR